MSSPEKCPKSTHYKTVCKGYTKGVNRVCNSSTQFSIQMSKQWVYNKIDALKQIKREKERKKKTAVVTLKRVGIGYGI